MRVGPDAEEDMGSAALWLTRAPWHGAAQHYLFTSQPPHIFDFVFISEAGSLQPLQ